jgi:hypothetical protein
MGFKDKAYALNLFFFLVANWIAIELQLNYNYNIYVLKAN